MSLTKQVLTFQDSNDNEESVSPSNFKQAQTLPIYNALSSLKETNSSTLIPVLFLFVSKLWEKWHTSGASSFSPLTPLTFYSLASIPLLQRATLSKVSNNLLSAKSNCFFPGLIILFFPPKSQSAQFTTMNNFFLLDSALPDIIPPSPVTSLLFLCFPLDLL